MQRVTKESKGQGDSVDNETVTSETKAEVTESPSETNVSDAEPEEKRKLLSNLRNLPFRGNSQKPLVNKFGFASKEETEPPPQEVNEYDSLQSCVLKEEESLSVLGFEVSPTWTPTSFIFIKSMVNLPFLIISTIFQSIMAIILGVCGPVVYLRKKKSAASQGFNRVPSNPRF